MADKRYGREPPGPEKRDANKALVIRALTDPEFREQLTAAPERVVTGEFSEVHEREIALVLAAVRGIEAQIGALADTLLCANGDPCGIAMA